MTLEEAIFKGVSSAADVGAAWQKEASDEVGKACSMEEHQGAPGCDRRLRRLASEPSARGLNAIQAKRWQVGLEGELQKSGWRVFT
ncbi:MULTISPECIES: hypothetical protein [unclassified Pseudomonas]|uniref:hypothetical protein n=1 Tax=unclassified Pseudomonas TaxID=196821 RepID=UPI0011AFBD52|nr:MULTISPECIES: hypothetical protein [unclassified Pseudomonas]